jgi:hypothetical protein
MINRRQTNVCVTSQSKVPLDNRILLLSASQNSPRFMEPKSMTILSTSSSLCRVFTFPEIIIKNSVPEDRIEWVAVFVVKTNVKMETNGNTMEWK